MIEMSAGSMNQHGCKILIIEHEFAIRYLLQNHLKEMGLEVLIAKEGEVGLKMAQDNQPALIAVNLQLPDGDGFSIFQALQDDPVTHNIPVVFIADHADQNDKYIAFESGAADFIVKPFLADEFLLRITAVIKKRRPQRRKKPTYSRVLALYSPKGGVGTTTLSIQLAKAMAIQYEHKTALLDLNLPLGGVAQKLNLYTKDNIVKLLSDPRIQQMDEGAVARYAQKQHTNLLVLPAPGEFVTSGSPPDVNQLICLFDYFAQEKITVIVDVGSHLNGLALATLRRADAIFAITSGEPLANRMLNSFYEDAYRLRLDRNRIFPVVNEINGRTNSSDLARFPVARIPTSQGDDTTRLWMQNQGIRKLVSFAC